MRTLITISLLCLALCNTYAQTKFYYKGKTKQTGQHCILVDDKARGKDDYTFTSLKDALLFVEQHNTKDTKKWTEVYIAPSVYWMDNPDDPEIRRPAEGTNTPFALTLNVNRLRLIGMGKSAEDVVVACNRGQTQGAEGNFTMFYIKGDNIEAKDITFGNYCNVDLVYANDTTKNRPRRQNAIVQAQLAICNGTGYRFERCRFISRLNLCPFVGARDEVFNECYFECTDDALSGNATYQKCRFTFYSGKPFYSTDPQTGATFIDCDIHCKTRGTQYLTKVSGPVSMTRCRWTSDDPTLKIEWSKRPDPKHICVMNECTLNGAPLHLPTPTDPLPVALPPFHLPVQQAIIPGGWTLDCYKPFDTDNYNWRADNTRSAWGYAEGMDGAEEIWGLVQLQRGARMMYTPANEEEIVENQTCSICLDPCKGPGQGFGSATGQYLDICIKFNTRTLTGYGIRFFRTPHLDKAVEVALVEYTAGKIEFITTPVRCDLFKRGCQLTLNAKGDTLTAVINNNNVENGIQTLTTIMPHPNPYAGFHLQHTGTTGAAATVVSKIFLQNK